MTDGSSAKEFIDNLVSLNANPPPEYNGSGEQFNKVLLNTANNAGLVAFYESAKNFFGGGSTASGNTLFDDFGYGTYGNIKYTTLSQSALMSGEMTAFSNSYYTWDAYTGYDNRLSITVNGVEIYLFYQKDNSCLSTKHPDGGYVLVSAYSHGSRNIFAIPSVCLDNKPYTLRFGFRAEAIDGNVYLHPFMSYSYTLANGEVHFGSFVPDSYSSTSKCFPICVKQADTKTGTLEIPYTNTTEFPWQNIIELISDYTSQGKEVTFDYTETLNAIQNQNQELLQNQRELLQQNADILAELEKLNNPTTDPSTDPETKPEGEGDLNVPKLPSLADKFPFCVPFDLIHLIQNLNATPKAPHWEIPFGFGLEDPYVIDIDFSDFEVLAAPIRWFCVIAFILGLILITRKIIQG